MYINPDILFIKKETNKKNSFFCSICSYPFITYKDFSMKEKYKCCHDCYLKFVEARKNDWNAGWRPNKKDIAAYVKMKKQINSSIITIKENKKWD